MGDDVVSRLKRRWLPVYVLLLAASLVVLGGLIYLYYLTESTDYATAAMVAAFFALYIGWSIYKVAGLKFKPRRVVTLVKCEKCGYSEEREYERGDFFFKEKGVCPKCGGPLLVAGIYVKEEGEGNSFNPLPIRSSLVRAPGKIYYRSP